MKLRIHIVLVVLLSLSCGSCLSDKANPTTNSNSPSSQFADASTSGSNGSEAMPADEPPLPATTYKAVLQNEAYFISADNNHEFLLDEFLSRDSEYAGVYTVTHFTVLDMDGDQIPEVVLELSLNDYPEQYEILHCSDGAVYGYNFMLRGFELPKEDGTYIYANSASDIGIEKILSFKPDSIETETIGYSQADYIGDSINISYFLHGATVSRKAFDVFYNQQNEKNDVQWYEFSAENIEARFECI